MFKQLELFCLEWQTEWDLRLRYESGLDISSSVGTKVWEVRTPCILMLLLGVLVQLLLSSILLLNTDHVSKVRTHQQTEGEKREKEGWMDDGLGSSEKNKG